MSVGTNTQVSATDKLAGFASNALDISAPQNPFELSRILRTSGFRNMDALFLSPALRALGDDTYMGEIRADKEKSEIQTRLFMSIELKAQRIAEVEKAMEEAEVRSRERNARNTRKPDNRDDRPDAPAQATRTVSRTTDRDDDDRPRLKRTFNQESKGVVERALETADRAVTQTVRAARRTAGDAVEATADAVGLDGKAARRVARDTVDGATSVVGTAFKVATNPVGAAVEYGAPVAKAAGNAVYNAASSGYNWLFGK